MQVLNRTQVTEVVTKRQISHTVLYRGDVFCRHESQTTIVYNMGNKTHISKPKVVWSIYVGSRTVQYLSAKEVKELELEKAFAELPINQLNGHVVESYYDVVKKRLPLLTL